MNFSGTFGFSNKRYINMYPDFFEKELQKQLDAYAQDHGDILNSIDINSLPHVETNIMANLSIPDEIRARKLPQILQSPQLKEVIKSLLNTTHEKIKNTEKADLPPPIVQDKQDTKVVFNGKLGCPYCFHPLTKLPTSKTKCPECKKDIFVRTKYDSKEKLLLTKKQVEAFEEDKKVYYFQKKWLNQLKVMVISDELIDETRKELRQKWGDGHPSFGDLVWGVFNKQLLIEAKKGILSNKMNWIYERMAMFVLEEGKDPFSHIKILKNNELREFKARGEQIVYVYGLRCCDNCKNLNGLKVNIDDALKGDSPLPNIDCTLVWPDRKYAFCNCGYMLLTYEKV